MQQNYKTRASAASAGLYYSCGVSSVGIAHTPLSCCWCLLFANRCFVARTELKMKGEAPKRRRVSAAAENIDVTSDIRVRTNEEKTQVQGPYRIIEPGNRQLVALDSGFLTDVTILVRDEAIKSHSLVVSFASPKLAAIVKENDPRLPNVDPRHFRLLLQIIYGGESSLPADVTSLLQVGHLAHELEVYSVIVFCAASLSKKVEIENLWMIIDFAKLIDSPQLEDICFKLIRNRAGHSLETDGFLNCTVTTLEKILRQDTLFNVTELQLFQACVAWSNANAEEVESRRAALSSALRLIRFRTFSAEDFAKHVCPTGLLSAEDERDIFRSFVTGENFMPKGFSTSTSPRDTSQIREIKLSAVGVKGAFNGGLPKNFGIDSIDINVNRDIFIYGVKLRAWRADIPEGYLYEENIMVAVLGKIENGRSIFEKTSFRGLVKNGELVSVKFKKPCELNTSVNFRLKVVTSQACEENLTLYKSDKIICDSGLNVHVKNEIWAPSCLHLIMAEKISL